ncbi:major facilitator superfamily domain-containing protein 9-like isoform X2 [Rhynchophorus ferrugineus]|uniref:major facilitator superfamily domain-containing protein 9-like isoform X2 n=1 Tax=Rhynchophorus ferrugineus TaxID=354439 RepID=UPI003FCD226F
MKVLYVLFAMDILNMAIILPVFNGFLKSLGSTPFTNGIINSSCAFISLLWNPVVGSLSDQVGRRNLLAKCLTANLLGNVVLIFSSGSLLMVYFSKLISAFGSPVNILLKTLVTDVYKTDEEKKAFFNKTPLVISVMFIAGSLLSGFMSEAENGFIKVFILLSCINCITIYVASTYLPDDTKTNRKTSNNNSLTKKAVEEIKSAVLNIKSINWSRYWDIFALKGAYEVSMTILLSNLGMILVNEFDIKGRKMGYVFLFMSVFGIIGNILKLKLKKTFEKIPDYTKIIYGSVILSIAYTGISLVGSIYTFMIFMACLSMCKTYMDTIFNEIISTKTLESDKGKVISAFDNLNPLAFFVVPVLSGIFAELFGQRLLIASANVPLSIVIFLSYRNKNKTE